MPITETEKELLFQQNPALKESPDSADPEKKNLAPPSQRVVRATPGASPDVIRHKPATSSIPAQRKSIPAPRQSSARQAPPAGETADARAEFAAAAARARAAAAVGAQQQPVQDSQAAVAQEQPEAELRRSRIPSQRQANQPPLTTAVEQVPQVKSEPRQRTQEVRREPAPQPEPEPEPVAPLQPRAEQAAPVIAERQQRPPAEPRRREEPPAQPHKKRASGTNFLLHTRGLRKVYDGRTVVDDVEITVRPSEIVGLLGPNGAGKTTSFYMIVGLVQPNGGSVSFNGKDATHEPMYRRARFGMGYLPQEESIFRKLSVEDNILAVMETQDIPRSERRDRTNELMKRFGIERLAKNIAITLSGGEKRRLTIARSLVTNPKLLMLDEPFSGVDPIAVGEIQDIVRDLREQGLAILITDHNVRETLGIVDRAYLLVEGKVIREGTRDFLMNDELSKKLYLGEQFSM